ncbi:MAG: MFS transporter [Sphingomonadales bacterium]
MSRKPTWRIIARLVPVLSAVYILSQFLRSSNGVIGPDLIRDIGLGPEGLGLLTGLFFVTFALAQIPVGVLIDNIGPRLTMAAFLAFAIAGSVFFARSETMVGLATGRALMGAGCSALLVGALIVYARWFPPDRFATMTSFAMGIGYSGIVLATAPLAWVASSLGWRHVFLGLAAIAGLLLLAVLVLVRDAPRAHPFHARGSEPLAVTARGLFDVLRNRKLRQIAPMLFISYGSMFSILGLWAGPYLHDVHGLGIRERGEIMLVMAVSAVVGLFCYGPLDRLFNTRKWLVVFGASCNAGVFLLLAIIPGIALWQITLAFALLAGLNGYVAVLIAHGRSIYPDRLVGRGMTVNNMINMGGVAVLQILTGFLIGIFPSTDGVAPESAYRLVFAALGGMLALALPFYIGSEDAAPRTEGRSKILTRAKASD